MEALRMRDKYQRIISLTIPSVRCQSLYDSNTTRTAALKPICVIFICESDMPEPVKEGKPSKTQGCKKMDICEFEFSA
jgi:hypothetical protein